MLSDSTGVGVAASDQDFAEKLSLWLNAFDAVKLHAVQQPVRASADGPPPDARAAASTAVAADVQRVRSALVKAIAAPVPETQADADAEAGYTPYRQRYAEQQRQMELKIEPLRDRVRQALSRVSPTLRQLAGLDAVLGQSLAGREQKLLAKVPVLLERRFEHLRQSGRLDVFGQEWQAVLQAELDLRLQPVMGMMEAMGHDARKSQ